MCEGTGKSILFPARVRGTVVAVRILVIELGQDRLDTTPVFGRVTGGGLTFYSNVAL